MAASSAQGELVVFLELDELHVSTRRRYRQATARLDRPIDNASASTMQPTQRPMIITAQTAQSFLPNPAIRELAGCTVKNLDHNPLEEPGRMALARLWFCSMLDEWLFVMLLTIGSLGRPFGSFVQVAHQTKWSHNSTTQNRPRGSCMHGCECPEFTSGRHVHAGSDPHL